MKTKASICSERALLYTQSFQQTEGQPYILRKTKAFAYTLDHMSLYLRPHCPFFGNQASRDYAAPIFPEYSIDWVIDELDQFEHRDGDRFYIDEKTKADLRRIQPYWHHQTHQDRVQARLSKTIQKASQQGVLHLGGISMSGDGHIVIDHELVLKQGLRPLIDQVKQKPQTPFYQSVLICLEASLRWVKRYAKLAQASSDESHQRIAQYGDTLMEKGARNFWEAIQICFALHVLQMIESNGHSFCYGRFDQYVLPYYEQEKPDDALELLCQFFSLNSTLNKVRPYGHTLFSQGYPLYSNLCVGGYRPDGKDGTNELSYLCVEAMKIVHKAEPNFSVRYHQDTPLSFLESVASLIRQGGGMPSMFNDHVAIKGLLDLDIPKEDAYDYYPIGCVETGVPGKYGHRATGMTYVNWGKVLEIVLHHGLDPKTGIQLINLPSHYPSYDSLWQAWCQALAFYTDLAVETDKICDESLAIYDADPFASALVNDCLALGKTMKEGGCRYDIISQYNIGPSIVGNSLYALKKLVYDKPIYTYEQVLSQLDLNWPDQRMHQHFKQLEKFGNDIDEVDFIVKDVFDSYLALLPTYQTGRTGPKISKYTMSTSNITAYIPNGFDVGATPDGRYAGEPLNEGCSPTQGTDINGPTALIHSVSKLPNDKVAAGQLLNLRFHPSHLSNQTLIAFLKACLDLGIYHTQYNIVDHETLKDAMVHPEQHEDLIVRVAGYCAQFISLTPDAQQAILERTLHELQ